MREELLKFHSSHYSSNLMGMVILGKECLDELAAVVMEMFSCIINNNVAVHEFPEHPYSDNELQVCVCGGGGGGGCAYMCVCVWVGGWLWRACNNSLTIN